MSEYKRGDNYRAVQNALLDAAESEGGKKHELKSDFVYESSIPAATSLEALQALEDWAQAWGEFTQSCKAHDILNSEQDLPSDVQPFSDKLESAVTYLESVLSGFTYKDYELGKIGWIDQEGEEAFVHLSIY